MTDVWHAFTRLEHEAMQAIHPTHPNHTTTPGAPAMNIPQLEQDIHAAVTTVLGHVRDFEQAVAPHLATFADVADKVAQSPLAQAVLAAQLGAEDEALIVSLVRKLDLGVHSLVQQGALQPQPAAEPGPDPAPGA